MTVRAYSPVLPSVELFGAYEGIASATAVNETVSITFTPTEGTLFVVPYDSDTISQLQLEVGPTPSSYIPTPSSGGTATRGAETLTVAAADLPWPTPKVIGPELVTNGTFDTDTSGWDVTNSGTISNVNERLRVTNGASGRSFGYTSFATEVGKIYAVNLDQYPGITSTSFLYVGTVAGKSNVANLFNFTGESIFLAFTAQSTTTYISLAPSTTGNGNYTEFDNISVREIDPLSVSIQMDGRMTYADTDDYEAYYWRWLLNIDRYLQGALDATSTRTGMPRFFQNDTSYTVAQVAGLDAYDPGVLVPYNIASRHGSTFINGAVDGTALTADTTPVALPDLSATDLQLAYDYMGTIRTFRMWDKDLGDAGIEEAST